MLGSIEKDFIFDSNIFNIPDNTAIEGYFQSYKYFNEYESEIKNDFQFKFDILNNCLIQIVKYNNLVSIHIRRGDYVTLSDHHTNLAEESNYYHIAMSKFPDCKFVFFSADIEWCKKTF